MEIRAYMSSPTRDPVTPHVREFEFTDRQFDLVRSLIRSLVGISLHAGKKNMVYSRLVRRVRKLGCGSFDEYLALIEAGDPEELIGFVNALTTNLTHFFREKHHFDALGREILPQFLAQPSGRKRLRIWSSACSTGQEPYSIALTIADHLERLRGWDVRILATDIDTQVLEHGRAGIYPIDLLEQIPEGYRKRWLRKGRNENAGSFRFVPEIRSFVTFNQLNLLAEWPMKGPFDVIFCRNVLIYFDRATQTELITRFERMLKPGGYLMLGHSERIAEPGSELRFTGRTIYRRVTQA